MKLLYNILFVLLFASLLLAQSADDSWKVFDDSQVARVDITINPASLQWLYQNVYSDSDFVAKIRFRNKYIDETVDSVGFRLRGNTSRTAKKKSFKIEFNAFIKGRRFYNLKDLNLNGEHNDPSISRSKFCFDHFQKSGFHASRAAHTEVYINGKYYGLYVSVEQIDDEFIKKKFFNHSGNLWKCLYPADLTYLGSDPNLYRNLNNNGVPAYELKTNETLNDFNSLVRFITALNKTSTSALPDSMESLIDVPDVLEYFALNVLLGQWDSYWPLMNNYYLYHDPVKDLFHLIPYDYDNTFGVDWFGTDWANVDPYNVPKVVSGARPLAEKLLANKQYRNLYTHYISFYRSKIFQLNLWEPHIDSVMQRITSYVLADSFRTLDYGFNSGHFFNSFSASPFSYQHVKYGIKQYTNQRNSSIQSQLNYQTAPPSLYSLTYSPQYPGVNDSVKVYISAFSESAVTSVKLYFTRSGGSPEVYPLAFKPVANTTFVEEADRYYGVIPPMPANTTGSFYITATDANNNTTRFPRSKQISLRWTAPANSIVINEFLADNVTAYPDPAGEYDDWLELYNPTSSPISLSGKYLTDNPSQRTQWRFPLQPLYLQPQSYLIVWCDNQLTQQGYHTNFKLSKSGEYIALTDSNGTTILDSITFGPQTTDISMGRFPDGSASWRALSPTPGTANTLLNVFETSTAKQFRLEQNYPNPFNPITHIVFSLPERTKIKLTIQNVLGETVAILADGEFDEGEHSFEWNASEFSAGTYFYTLLSENFMQTKKILLLK